MSQDPLEEGAAATYDAASECYDAPALAFRDHASHAAVECLGLVPGTRVLDVCCGTGAASLAAAAAVGPTGAVLGIDYSPKQLKRAQAKAEQLGLKNVEFRPGDLAALDLPAGSFDAVICVFGIFFVEDMTAALRGLWRLTRPGGKLAVTTWAERTFEPGNSAFWDAVQTVRPDLNRHGFPWSRIDTPDLLRGLFDEAGIPEVTINGATFTQPLASPDEWWTIVRGSGFRAIVEQMTSTEVTRVRDLNLTGLRMAGSTAVEAHTLHAVARKGVRA